MKKLIIKISDSYYKGAVNHRFQAPTAIIEAIRNGKVIPEDYTNGDMIRAIFGCEVCEPIEEDDIIHVIFRDNQRSAIGFDYNSWWNKPYKAHKGGEMELQGKFKYTLEDLKVQVKASTLKVGDRLITEDIAGKAVFEVAEIRKKYIYMVRRYCLPDKYDQTHDDLMDFLNNEYLDTLPQDLKNIMGKREGSRIFVPWFKEVFGERKDCGWADQSKGKQWKLFKKGYGRIRLNASKRGCSRWYWLASPYISNSADFCVVDTSGAPYNANASSSTGVLPCFKINRKAIAEQSV